MMLPPAQPWAYETRSFIVSEIERQLGTKVTTLITYAEVAHTASIEDVLEFDFDYVYGSNLQHALLVARAASRTTGSSRIVLVTYSLPSAHHISGQAFFSYPPIVEGRACASDGIRIDTLLVTEDASNDEGTTLQRYFRPMTEEAGGKFLLVTPSDHVEDSVGQFLRLRQR